MHLALTDERYRYGSYTRGDLKGDILYGVVSIAGVNALVSPQFALARDAWAERHQARLPKAQIEEYKKQLADTVKAKAGDEAYFEAILDSVLALRRRVFGVSAEQAFFWDAESADERLSRVDISQEAMLDKLLQACGSVVFFLSDARFFGLMQKDMQRARERGLSLYAAVSPREGGVFPARRTMEALFPDGGFICLSCPGPLNETQEDKALVHDAGRNRAFLLYYGERGLTECRNLAVPAFVRCLPESLTGKALAGQFIHSGRCDLYVPAHFDILPGVPLRQRTVAAFRQYAYLAEQYGEACYSLPFETLYSRWPQAFFSVYDEEHRDFPPGIQWPADGNGGDWYADFCARRDAALGAALDAIPGVKRLGGWFDLESHEQRPVPWDHQGEAQGICVHGVLIEKTVNARIVLAEGEAISPRALAAESRGDGMGLILNYLFFLTPRLAALYNQLRKDRPREQAALRGGHLDYMRCRRGGQRMETFPLYRKACMALREDGSFAFFHFRLGGGACEINGQPLRWEADCVDAAAPGEIVLYTPYLSRADAGESKFTYTKAVGAGRVNLAIVQDQVICARDGDVLLPPMGVVISLEREAGLRFCTRCGFAPGPEGYFSWAAPPALRLTLDAPEGFSPAEWNGIRWAYGGGLTLIHRGKSCFASADAAAAHLFQEGWTSPLSCQTQESDIGSMVRHPRTAIGLTKQGKLFALVYSGRAAFSAGADYSEMCDLALRLVPDVEELMNVDGGGSALLAITFGNRLVEYSWPSSSPGTLPGMARPVNSLFQIQL